ncbi:glycosyltransferase family 2 protein [Lepagella muris]|jgi:glycosyltransferase involved in cell wall biosynthesis|uniref:Glycosyltransferase n=1 Tax=Lepagella muris TaxID=3032870 RepID=A0AC61RAQ2_9BACT|nr:glycosyltransferase family 2 protein [Lepagella muris]ROT02396.1 glycosyltransferase [Muribaculaceae bacterium Isolate-037 (Harlan)]TGY76814.1 glycosyltransferase [Lepagella muris]THG47930.1 glycosyltransferase family 2 protein [Bacteroidales bacterium]TKC54575.1 glycosyltransferase family 2 protein [Bacteroidales bacterium]
MDRERRIRLALVVPCFQEESALPRTNDVLTSLLLKMSEAGLVGDDSYIVYVDDGSTDGTWGLISGYACCRVKGIRLSRNFGHQYALLAGMEYVAGNCDACVTIDADLQDDPSVIPDMVRAYMDGSEIVYGVRSKRVGDGWFKRHSAHCFYTTLRHLGVECVYDHADFRLLGRDALSALLEYGERNVFLRGIVPKLGYRQSKVYYQRGERKAGSSKYPLGKMIEFAGDGVTSFSVRPVRMLFWLGVVFMMAALLVGIYVMARYFSGETIEGWTSLILSIWFCTGILLIGLGILGEYVGKMYVEVKKRPRYNIAETV